jgi:hypothetical protein
MFVSRFSSGNHNDSTKQKIYIYQKLVYHQPNNMSVEVARAAAVGDVETVNKWLTARGYTHYGQLMAVIQQAVIHGHDNICQLLLDCDAIRNMKAAMNLRLQLRVNSIACQ